MYIVLLDNKIVDISTEYREYPLLNDGSSLKCVEYLGDKNIRIGDFYNFETNEIIETIKIPSEPTQADRIEENQLALMEAVASMYEESLENRLNDQEVQATIYETLLEMGGN